MTFDQASEAISLRLRDYKCKNTTGAMGYLQALQKTETPSSPSLIFTTEQGRTKVELQQGQFDTQEYRAISPIAIISEKGLVKMSR
jgi:hypothetical protein